MKKKLSLLLVLTIVLLSGCQSINLSEEKEDLVAEYAANLVLQRSYSYDKVLVDVNEQDTMKESGEETTTSLETSSAKNTVDYTTPYLNSNRTEASLNEAFQLDNFDLSFSGYQVLDSYPDTFTSDTTFVLNPTDGFQILVLKLKVTNQSNEAVTFHMKSDDLSYSLSINNKKNVNATLSLLLDSLNTYSDDFAINETKELLLIFQVAKEDATSITSLTLETDSGSNQYYTTLK